MRHTSQAGLGAAGQLHSYVRARLMKVLMWRTGTPPRRGRPRGGLSLWPWRALTHPSLPFSSRTAQQLPQGTLPGTCCACSWPRHSFISGIDTRLRGAYMWASSLQGGPGHVRQRRAGQHQVVE